MSRTRKRPPKPPLTIGELSLLVYMTADQYAAHRGVSVRTVNNWIQRFAAFPSVKSGWLRRIDRARADAWLDSGGANQPKQAESAINPAVKKPRRNARRPSAENCSRNRAA